MKKTLLLLVSAVVLSGCASATMPVTGFLYGNVKAPMAATASSGKTHPCGPRQRSLHPRCDCLR